MPAPSSPAPAPGGPRVLARRSGPAPGPALIAIGGLHGNEPSGIQALRRVDAEIASRGVTLCGDLVMLAGNLGALERNRRFLDHDLNRGWTAERLEALRNGGPAAHRDAEDREQLELSSAIEAALQAARGPAFLLDLHATSAEGIPFSLCRDTPEARRFAGAFPLTLVLGLIESLSGTLAGHYGSRCTAVVVEGGQNSNPATAGHHEAVVWLALVAAGMLEERAVARLADDRDALGRTRGGLPPVLHVHHRHAIAPGDRFTMAPGFANIQRIAAHELLGHDRHGEIRAPAAGFVLMPLYQAMGDDGFFLGREVE